MLTVKWSCYYLCGKTHFTIEILRIDSTISQYVVCCDLTSFYYRIMMLDFDVHVLIIMFNTVAILTFFNSTMPLPDKDGKYEHCLKSGRTKIILLLFCTQQAGRHKGQLISEWIYQVIVSPKIQTKNCQDFCPHYTGQKFWQFFVRILGETMTS